MSRHKKFALVWALIVCLLIGHNAYLWLDQHIVPDTDILALLPVQQRDPVLQQSFTHMVDAAQQRVVVLIGAEKWDDAKRAADAYSAVLAKNNDLIDSAALGDQLQSDWLQSFKQHSLTLLSTERAAQLRSQPPGFWIDLAMAKLYSPFAGPKLGTWRDDPFGLFSDWVQERAQETPVRPRDGHLFVAGMGKQYVLLPLTLRAPAFSLQAQQKIVPLLQQAEAAAHQAMPQAEVITGGIVLHAAAAGRQASHEISTIGIGSLIGIILLTWFAFTSFRPVVLILLSITIGCLGSFSICWMLFGRIHLLTLVFGASLIGVAQDYGIYFLCNRMNADKQLDSFALLKRLMPGLCLTLLAAVIGYAGLALTPFPGLRQMALFSALGLVFAWLTVIFWFPLLIDAGRLKGGALVSAYAAILRYWPRIQGNRATIIAAIIFFGLAAIGCAQLGANDDIRLLQHSPTHLIQDQIKLGKLLDAPSPVQYFLVRGQNAELVLQREETLKQRLDPLIANHTIAGYQAMSNWVPSLQMQKARRDLLAEKLFQDQGPLSVLSVKIGEDQAWTAETKANLLAAGKDYSVDDFLQSPASEPWRHLWLGEIDGTVASIVALRGLTHAGLPLVQQAGVGVAGVQWVDKVDEISSVLGRYRHYMGWVLASAYLTVFCLLFLRYRGDAWRVLSPAAIASIATLTILGFAGQDLQLFHVLALMLLLGVGVDYGIFMQERANQQNATPWLAVGLSAVSTILSFGLLALSDTPALRAFGITMLIGIAGVWIVVACFGKDGSDDAKAA